MRNLILKGVAESLNACGKAVVFSYDACASSMGKMCDVAKKTPGATKKLFKAKQKEVFPRESPMEPEAAAGVRVHEPPAKKAEPRTISSKMKKISEPSRSVNIKRISAENLKRMVKPQLISLCNNLNIECNYTDTKTQIIAKILERKGS
jgi:hypothetical protein